MCNCEIIYVEIFSISSRNKVYVIGNHFMEIKRHLHDFVFSQQSAEDGSTAGH